MIKRTLATKLKKATTQFPVVTVTGPRQSGKTTLVKAVFKDYYLSLELPDQRQFGPGRSPRLPQPVSRSCNPGRGATGARAILVYPNHSRRTPR